MCYFPSLVFYYIPAMYRFPGGLNNHGAFAHGCIHGIVWRAHRVIIYRPLSRLRPFPAYKSFPANATHLSNV